MGHKANINTSGKATKKQHENHNNNDESNINNENNFTNELVRSLKDNYYSLNYHTDGNKTHAKSNKMKK